LGGGNAENWNKIINCWEIKSLGQKRKAVGVNSAQKKYPPPRVGVFFATRNRTAGFYPQSFKQGGFFLVQRNFDLKSSKSV